jgi:ribosomal protein S14
MMTTDLRVSRRATPRVRKPPLTPRAVATALRTQALRNGYSITVRERDERFDEQAHRCAICGRPFRRPAWHLECTFTGELEGRRIGTSPAVDHDHKTGLVRGLLCRFCNREVVPMIERHSAIVERARIYVREGGWRTE